MKSEGMAKNIALSAFGFVILITGFVLAKLLPDTRGIMRTLPYICIGIGAGVFGGNLGTLIKKLILKKDPKAAKEIEIEAKDERNIAINNKAKAKAYDLMQIVFGSLILVFALMQVDMYVVLAFIAAYLFIIFSMIYYLNKYCKEM
ncbi:MAG TPA: hypothetical protein GXX36_15795 [Clostridiaceae bacterium]|nr:hypothetical protein [Clostridiaceae bacterium]